MKEVKVGLIKGRHEMPVESYIFDVIENVLDFDAIHNGVVSFMKKNIDSDVRLVVYVTGLTSVTAEVIKVCALNQVKLTLMHYDRESGNYLPQVIF